jgi:trk system potassium uptake protein TrkA
MDTRDQHVIIVGSGRVGSGLSTRLVERGYSVAVIDADRAAFRRIREPEVLRVEGVGYDHDTLIRAGVERAVGLAAVTNGDNTNIVVARTAREAFKVPRVLARIYDVRRAAIYERLGVPTVASALLTIEMSLRQILPNEDSVRWVDPSARVCIVEHPAPQALVGRPVTSLERDSEVRIVAVRRLGSSVLPTDDLVVQEGDVIYAAVAGERLEEIELRTFGVSTGGRS